MQPHLVKWHDKYNARGLTVIEVDCGAIDSLPAVESHVRRDRIPYVVFYDTDGAMCRLYGVSGFPTQFLIGRDGNLIWEGGGYSASDLPSIEREIQKALGKG